MHGRDYGYIWTHKIIFYILILYEYFLKVTIKSMASKKLYIF